MSRLCSGIDIPLAHHEWKTLTVLFYVYQTIERPILKTQKTCNAL